MPRRSYSVSPQGGGPLRLLGRVLAQAFWGQLYSQNIAPQASAGNLPYSFSGISNVGPDSPALSSGGVISMTPIVPSVRVTSDGSYRVTSDGSVRIAVP